MTNTPNVTVATDKPEYDEGDAITLTYTVDADTRTVDVMRVIVSEGKDDEDNPVSVRTEITTHRQVPDSFELTSVRWEDTGVALSINGLQATGTA